MPKKIVSSILSIIFLLSHSLHCSPEKISNHVRKSLTFDFLPKHLGRIVQEYKGADNRFVYIIEDVHCDESVQENIFGILKYLKNKHKNKFRGSRYTMQSFNGFIMANTIYNNAITLLPTCVC